MRVITFLLASSFLGATSAYAVDGGSLFESRCRLCHEDKQTIQEKSRKRIESVLRSEKISEHRFMLSEEEIDALVIYLADQH